MAQQLADRYDIPQCYSNMDEMLGSSHVDVVHIITPPTTHLPLTLTALEAGCHVLVEKPFTINAAEAVEAIEKAKSLRRKITVNHFHDFSPPALRLRQAIAQGALGDIIHIESFYGYSLNSPVAQALLRNSTSWFFSLPGKLLQNNISHLLAKTTQLIPDEELNVIAFANRLSKKDKNTAYSDIHEELRVLIHGERTSAYATFSANIKPLQHFMIVYGTRNTISLDYEARTLVYEYSATIPGSMGKLLASFNYGKQYLREGAKNAIKFAKSDFHYYSGMNMLLTLFYDCITNDSRVPIPYDEIIRMHKLMDAIFNRINERPVTN